MNIIPSMRQWYETHVAGPARRQKASSDKRKTAYVELLADKNEVTPLTKWDQKMIGALCNCHHYHRASFESRFIDSARRFTEMSVKQRTYLWRLADRQKHETSYFSGKREILRVMREFKAEMLRAHRDGIDWRPEHTVPEDHYA